MSCRNVSVSESIIDEAVPRALAVEAWCGGTAEVGEVARAVWRMVADGIGSVLPRVDAGILPRGAIEELPCKGGGSGVAMGMVGGRARVETGWR